MVDEDGLSELHDSRGSESSTLDTIIDWAQNAVRGTDAGIFLLHAKGRLETAVPTSREMATAHELQIELNEGPCLQVINDDNVDTYVIGETATDDRFPTWGPAAAELGFHSVLSVVLKTSQKRFGSLNVYSGEPDAFDRDDLAVIDIFSRRAARAMAVAEDSSGLTTALDTRKLIGQAQGIVMERFDIDADRAFDYLVRQSQARNEKIRALAEWIVTNRSTNALSDLDL
ncbi:MAG TPA: GAF and ANTAR domain-containing protein [Aeromicrobium sp.]|nr:GAF and ANTAR domain-containing protein [Aeromicrobium sp.]